MGNSHPSGGKTLLVYRPFRDRDCDVNFWQEQREEAVHVGKMRKNCGAHLEPGTITPGTFHFIGLIERIARRPAIGGSSDVEQWKQIPRKAESGTHAFL